MKNNNSGNADVKEYASAEMIMQGKTGDISLDTMFVLSDPIITPIPGGRVRFSFGALSFVVSEEYATRIRMATTSATSPGSLITA